MVSAPAARRMDSQASSRRLGHQEEFEDPVRILKAMDMDEIAGLMDARDVYLGDIRERRAMVRHRAPSHRSGRPDRHLLGAQRLVLLENTLA